MPLSYDIDVERSILRVEAVGRPPTWDFGALNRTLLQDPRVEPGMACLCDYSRAEGVSTMDGMRRNLATGQLLMERLGRLRVAIVTPRDANYGMANAASVFAQDIPGLVVRPFRSLAEAERWLTDGRDDPT